MIILDAEIAFFIKVPDKATEPRAICKRGETLVAVLDWYEVPSMTTFEKYVFMCSTDHIAKLDLAMSEGCL
jgi:hypothetical protein